MSIRPSGSGSASSACRRSPTQAPPVCMPIMAVRAVIRPFSSPASWAHSFSASGRLFIEILLEDQLRRDGVYGLFLRPAQRALRLDRGEALFDARHRQAEAALELARETLDALRERMHAALRDRQA